MQDCLNVVKPLAAIALFLLISACAPEVGSAKWCKMIEEKSKTDLTMNEAKDYAKHCVFK